MSDLHYLIKIDYSYSASNKLHTAIYEMLRQLDRIIVDEATRRTVQKKILENIEELNKLHPRCKPVQARWNSWDEHELKNNTHHLELGYNVICSFRMYGGKMQLPLNF